MDNWYSDMREALVSVCQKNMLCNPSKHNDRKALPITENRSIDITLFLNFIPSFAFYHQKCLCIWNFILMLFTDSKQNVITDMKLYIHNALLGYWTTIFLKYQRKRQTDRK